MHKIALWSYSQRRIEGRRNPTINRKSGSSHNIVGRSLLSLLLLPFVCVKVVENPKPLLVGANPIVNAKAEDYDINDVTDTKEEIDLNIVIDEGENGEEKTVEPSANFPGDDNLNLPLPTSLMKATRVGAKLREVQNPAEQAGNNNDNASLSSATTSINANKFDVVPFDTKPPSTGCNWGAGAMGCKKENLSATGPGEMNTSSIETDAEYLGQGGANSIDCPPSSSLAGSAAAKIEAHVMKGRGLTLGQRRPASSPPMSNRDNVEPIASSKKEASGAGHKPPQGFKLAGRIVTSPSDGLSYFLDMPQVDSISTDGDWMMTIPYAYLECGPTIESTTEAFSLADMVLRLFPASASMGHWTNLGGGVTIENAVHDGDEDKGTKYIDGNHEGNPGILVALSSIEITVSGNNEESRIFNPGDVVLMEDTLGKGHKMNAAPMVDSMKSPDGRGRDLNVLMVSLPHTVHFPLYRWLEGSSYLSEDAGGGESPSAVSQESSSPLSSSSLPTSYGAEHTLLGFAPKNLHQKHQSLRERYSFAFNSKKPCPLEYDSAYSSLFTPAHNLYHRQYGNRRNPLWTESQPRKELSFDESYPPPPGFSTYEKTSVLFDFLPSLRRTMLFGLGLSLTTSFIYCVQLLYPPLLVLWGGGTVVVGGALLSVLVTRWGYRNWAADWEEEWRWKREVKRIKVQREEKAMKKQVINKETIVEVSTFQRNEGVRRDGHDQVSE